MLTGSGATAQALESNTQNSSIRKGVIYIIYREYLQVRKKHHCTKNKKAHRGFGPHEMTPACVRSSLALGRQGDHSRARVLEGEKAESTGTLTENGGLAEGASELRWGHIGQLRETKTGCVALSDKSQRQGHWPTNDSIQAKKMVYLPLGHFLDRPAKCRRRLGQGAKCTFSRDCRPTRTENPQLPLRYWNTGSFLDAEFCIRYLHAQKAK